MSPGHGRPHVRTAIAAALLSVFKARVALGVRQVEWDVPEEEGRTKVAPPQFWAGFVCPAIDAVFAAAHLKVAKAGPCIAVLDGATVAFRDKLRDILQKREPPHCYINGGFEPQAAIAEEFRHRQPYNHVEKIDFSKPTPTVTLGDTGSNPIIIDMDVIYRGLLHRFRKAMDTITHFQEFQDSDIEDFSRMGEDAQLTWFRQKFNPLVFARAAVKEAWLLTYSDDANREARLLTREAIKYGRKLLLLPPYRLLNTVNLVPANPQEPIYSAAGYCRWRYSLHGWRLVI